MQRLKTSVGGERDQLDLVRIGEDGGGHGAAEVDVEARPGAAVVDG